MKDKYIGCMIGSALGDAIGELAQHTNNSIETLTAKKLFYTDDTAMTIDVALFLLEGKKLSTKRLGDIILAHIKKEPDRGYGGSQLVFYMAEMKKMSYTKSCLLIDTVYHDGKGSWGNGGAMRIAPVGLLYENNKEIYSKTKLITKIDHNNEIAIDGAAVMAKAVSLTLQQNINTEIFCNKLISFSKTQEIKEKINFIKESILKNTKSAIVDKILGNNSRSETKVSCSMPFAVYSFLSNLNSFENCIKCAISTKGDADTIGAMAGALSGSFLGVGKIKKKWIGNLENSEYITSLSIKLYNKKYLWK